MVPTGSGKTLPQLATVLMLPGNKTKAWSRKSDYVCVCRESH